MPEQYFTPRPAVPSNPKRVLARFQGREYAFTTDSGVFSREGLDAGTELLLKALPALGPGARGLDLGCGWGPVGVLWALESPEAEVLMTDINERAAALAGENARANGAANARAVSGDGLERCEGLFEAIALNPPIRAGKETVYRLFREAMAKLGPGGALYAVMRVRQGADSAKRMLAAEYGSCETVARGGGYHVLKCVKEAREI